ncbi:MAG TPA: transposase, partial [Gaiellales bacterium]|nr:transposase [Gaiellales bacterium]
MPRKLRPQVAGGLYHVTMRGNNRAEIFNSDEDRTTLLNVIGRAKRRYGWKVHAYCLMSNHYHLLTETPEPNIAAGMQWLNSTYAHRFNEKYERIGHLFQRRYADGIILTDEHLREVIRYIPLNPVRAGLCKRPVDWPWSSYRATLGSERRERFLSVRPTLDRFSPDRDVARTLLREWIEEGRREIRSSNRKP